MYAHVRYYTPLIGGGIKRCFCLTSVCLSDVWRLSRTSGLSREQRGLGRLKLAHRLPTSHVTRTPLSGSNGQRSRSPGRFSHRGITHRQLQRSAWERIERGKLLLRCRLQARWSARRREALRRPQWEERGGGILCRHAHTSFIASITWSCNTVHAWTNRS